MSRSRFRMGRGAWGRRMAAALGVAALVMVFVPWLLTRSWFLAARVEPVLERILGGEITLGRVSYAGRGSFRLQDLVLRVPGWSGPKGEILRIGNVRVVVDMGRLVQGQVWVKYVELGDVNVRLSEDEYAGGTYNFMSLAPDWPETADPMIRPPRVQINSAVLEVGVHGDRPYRRRGLRIVSGSMNPIVGEDGWYKLTLIEVDREGQVLPDEGLLIDGRWNVRTNAHEVTVESVELDDRVFNMCPQIAQLWWKRMNLSGRVANVSMKWSEDVGSRIEFGVDDIALTFPIAADDIWARYESGKIVSVGTPRMEVHSGTIRMSREEVVLDALEGELVSDPAPGAGGAGADAVGVPYVVTMRIRDIPPLDWANRERWMDDVVDTAPFELTFRSEQFAAEADATGLAPAVELPLPVARVLEKFNFDRWVLGTSLDLTREAPSRDAEGVLAPAPIRSSGQAFISRGAGAYDRFQYPLREIEAYVEFTNERVDLHWLTGRGSNDARVRVSGTIGPLTREAAVHLELQATDVPVDEALLGALQPQHRAIVESMMHAPSFLALDRARLLVDRDRLADTARQRADAVRELEARRGTGTDSGAVARLTALVRRCDELLNAGPFEMGGTIGLSLSIDRVPGERTITTGQIRIDELGIIHERFPYALRTDGGTLYWTEDGIELGEAGVGIPVTTAGGGHGALGGTIRFLRASPGEPATGARTALRLEIENDAVSDALLAAVPPSDVERGTLGAAWPGAALSRAGRWIADLGTEGVLAYTADITSDGTGPPAVQVDVDVAHARLRPGPAVAGWSGGDPSRAPLDWRVERGEGRLRVTTDTLALEGLRGRLLTPAGEGIVTMDGSLVYGVEPVSMDLRLAVDDLPLAEELLTFLPEEQYAAVADPWRRLAPEGAVDIDLACRRDGAEPVSIALDLRAEEIEIGPADRRVTLTGEGGVLHLQDDRLRFDDLVLTAREGARHDGMLVFDGPGDDLRLEWRDGGFESPLVPMALRTVGSDDGLSWYGRFRPEGRFDADLRLGARPVDGRRPFEVRLRPRNLTIRLRDVPIAFEVDDGAEIVARPGQLEFGPLRCRHPSGRLEASGILEIGRFRTATVALEYEGRLRCPEVLALLPTAARDALEQIDFEEDAPSRVRDGVLVLEETPGPGGIPAWYAAFSGTIELQDASFDAGLRFSEVAGPFDLRVAHRPGGAPLLDLLARPRHLRVLGQRLRDGRAVVRLSPDGSRVIVDSFSAGVGDGVVTADAAIGLAPDGEYALAVRLAGVPLDGFEFQPPSAEAADGSPPEPPAPPEPPESPAPAEPRDEALARDGELYGSIDLAGVRGDPGARVGRGILRALGGRLGGVPGALQIMQLFHMTIPGQSWDYADIRFFIGGSRLVFERLLLESTIFEQARDGALSQQLEGTGTLDLDTLEIDARFRSRGGVLFVRDVVGGLGDRLAAIRIKGPLWAPSGSLVPLPPADSSLAAAPRLRAGPAPEPELP